MGVDAAAPSAAVGIYVDDVYFPSGPGALKFRLPDLLCDLSHIKAFTVL
jgi:hypothetical protein